MDRKNKKILFLLPYPLSNNGRILNFISSIEKYHEVIVFALDDKNTRFSFKPGTTLIPYSINNSIKIKILRHSFFWLEFSELEKIVCAKLGDTEVDQIICFDLPSLFPALKIRDHYKTKLHYDSLEIYNETLNQFFPGVNRIKRLVSKILIRFMKLTGKHAEKKLVNRVDSMSTVNESLKAYFIQNYCYSNISVIMNCPSLNHQVSTDIDFRVKYNLPVSSVIFLYQGVLNEGRGLELLIKAFGKAIVLDNSIRLIILGDGVIKEKLKKLAIELDLINYVFFHDKVDYKCLINYTMAADIGINLLESLNLSKAYASPNKLFEYMQAEIPVICSFSKENDIVFRKFKIGIQTQNNIDCICEKIVILSNEIKTDKNRYKTDLKLAKKEYCWENQEEKLFQITS